MAWAAILITEGSSAFACAGTTTRWTAASAEARVAGIAGVAVAERAPLEAAGFVGSTAAAGSL
jgi:hypothetical protein